MAGCAIDPSTPILATSSLPDCFVSNYDAQRDLFTINSTARNPVNQQCALYVGSHGGTEPAPRLAAGRYTVYLANGGGGGAGGTLQLGSGMGGGAGGGGAGAREVQTVANLAEGSYRLTIGGGGPGGAACVFALFNMSGGPGWAGSPSNIVRISSGELVAGVPGADSFARPTRAQHDRAGGLMDGHGGSGPGQTGGGHGGTYNAVTGGSVLAESGQNRLGAEGLRRGGIPGGNEDRLSAGGGGGATSRSDGGGGGGENPGHANRAPQRGSLGSGGGGGEGSRNECDPGARGGHGFIALRRI